MQGERNIYSRPDYMNPEVQLTYFIRLKYKVEISRNSLKNFDLCTFEMMADYVKTQPVIPEYRYPANLYSFLATHISEDL